ncbi:hypothetical protein HSX37_04880|uniref:Uncharacterized protein n=1 Tax=Dendrosporobacter quercicolus TaxID=146817 RepID=A0A1G9NL09_9FIRM|nr:hypothetical protein [Dendrosporobacter quercicolus]NSL47378.1 hypothetical protein [Dendrosporobacter quercicolus DSM 1736]SDL87292.1 hypothetical protein SAMN04488502_1011053 [Dendrosporobacter quercicolus]
MKMFSLRMLLVLSLLVGLGSAGAVPAEAARTAPAGVRVEQWTGQDFTFLALPAEKQSTGYEIFAAEQATRGLEGDRSLRIPYAEHVGKQVVVTKIVPFAAGGRQKEYMVYMTVKETDEKLVGRTMQGQLEGLLLSADLRNARQQFLGKTVYPKFRELTGLYVPGRNSTPPASVSTPIGAPVVVLDVYAGNKSQEPIWLIVDVNGEKAILPIAYSWTNMPIQSWTETPPWQNALFMKNPRISLGGSDALWQKIQAGNVEEGMSKEQVQLSWGNPSRREKNDSVWIYGTKQLQFRGDVLYSIATISESQPGSYEDLL